MISLVRGGGKLPWELTLAWWIWVLSGSSAIAYGDGFEGVSYGGPGLYPGFFGFGLSYHLGYGYGGYGLGVGGYGGYPYYGGPGYPNGEPRLRRFGGISPFPYHGGGHFSYDYPYSVAGMGQLVANRPVVTGSDRPDLGSGYPHSGDFGPFTGAFPYPDSFFAPYASASAGSSSGASSSDPATTAARARNLGIDEEPAVDADGVRGMKVTKVYPGTAAEKAGLQAGDLLRSINGYLTEQPGNVAWIIANAAPENVLEMNVRKGSDGTEHTVTAQLP
jgi:hypothetical protein